MIWPLRGLANNPALPPHLLDLLVYVPEIHKDLAHRDDLTPDHARILVSGGDDRVIYALLAGGLITTAPLDEPEVALMVAMFDRSVALSLASHPNAWVRAQLADFVPQLPADVVDLLAHDLDPVVVAQVAQHQPLSLALAEELSRHPDPEVCGSVGLNFRTPVEVAVRFAEHEDESVRMKLAMREDLPIAIYEKFARDRSKVVRWTVASNPLLPETSLRALATDPIEEVRNSLLSNPVVPLDVLVAVAPTVPVRLAERPRIAAATLTELRGLLGSGTEVRVLVAARADLPPELVAVLVADADLDVTKAVVTNPALSAAQLWDLVERHGPPLYPRAARNPACPPDLLEHLATVPSACREIAKHPNASAAALLLCLPDDEARHVAARHPNLPVATIVDLLRAEPYPAAANPSLPVSAMEALLEEYLP